VRLPEFIRSTTFRWSMLVSGAYALCIILMFGFVYWRTADYLIASVDQLIGSHADAIAGEPPDLRLAQLQEHLKEDPRRVKLGGLFDAGGSLIGGNIQRLPPTLQLDAGAQSVPMMRSDALGRERQVVRAVGRRLPGGGAVVIGRNVDELTAIARVVERALVLGLVPALILGFAVGAFLSIRAQRRIEAVNRKIRRIIAGELRQRLPTRASNDPFDKLASLVNGMLEKIEDLVRSVAGVGDDIAHDLRTPLTRVRVGLERGRQNAKTVEELRAVADQAILGLDQSLAIITALLRIAEIEHGRRRAGFGDVVLSELVREIGDLYEPITEDKRIAFAVRVTDEVTVRGDRDLLFEAIANLVDNAIKFTPDGGRVELILLRAGEDGVIRVADNGPGIAVSDRDLVTRRFYRSDKSRQEPGFGLGLSLVSAIVKLHGFRLAISAGPGCVAEIAGLLAKA
jgi:signal transduction histidine kinase